MSLAATSQRQRARLASVFVAFVALLLRAGGPATVIWRVWPIVIDAVHRVFRGRPSTHISKEGLKGTAPAVADHNSAPAISEIGLISRVEAARLHPKPRSVFCGVGRVQGFAVSSSQPSRKLSGIAATANRVPLRKAVAEYRSLCAAIATAIPIDLLVGNYRSLDDSVAAESFTSQIGSDSHGLHFTTGGRSVSLA